MGWNDRESLKQYRDRMKVQRTLGRQDAMKARYKANPSKVWAIHNVEHPASQGNHDDCQPCAWRSLASLRKGVKA